MRTAALQKRYIPIVVLTLLAALTALAGYLPISPAPQNPQATVIPERILLDNAAGKVVFDHKKHAENAGIACQTCHHESLVKRYNVQKCNVCHGVTFDQKFRKNHAQDIKDPTSCATCHHVEFAAKVAWDHKKHVEEYSIDCRSCHHTDVNIEPEPQNCADCHQKTGDKAMPSIRNAVHARCASCHADMFDAKVKGCAQCHTKIESKTRLITPPATLLNTTPTTSDAKPSTDANAPSPFTVNPMYADCAVCHVGQKTQELVPDRMNAFHGQCIKCHEKTGKGPFTKEQCSQCHTK